MSVELGAFILRETRLGNQQEIPVPREVPGFPKEKRREGLSWVPNPLCLHLPHFLQEDESVLGAVALTGFLLLPTHSKTAVSLRF